MIDLTENSCKDPNTVPIHIAIIPDGNRRWAKSKNLPVIAGHKAGAVRFKEIVKAAYQRGIKFITFYAFSTENWNRTESEVEGLMKLLGSFLLNYKAELGNDGDLIRICVIGEREKLPEELRKQIDVVESATKSNTGIVVNIAINYGSRDEIVSAVKKISKMISSGNVEIKDIDEKMISENLYTKDYPDPDLVIRTSGEQRISNFLLWQIAYSELYFCDCYWPDFDENELDKAIDSYASRKRRFGK